jgi:toxin ParE1/3/4
MLRLRLSAAAHADIIGILAHTERQFGALARLRYEALIVDGLRAVASDPARIGSHDRPEVGPDTRTYHLWHIRNEAAGRGAIVRKPRHLILYRVRGDAIEIGRILHDSMELIRHGTTAFGDS